MKRGKLSDLVSDLTDDVRRVMEPHTAVNWARARGGGGAAVLDEVARQLVPRTPPLVDLNNFGDAPHHHLATITFQNLFPPINVKKVKLSTCQRAVGD